MSEFDRENEDVFSLVRENRRRSDLAPVIGYIVPMKQAQSYAAYEAAQARNGSGIGSLILAAVGMLAVVTVTVLAIV